MIQGYAIPNATMLGNNGAYKSEFYKALEGAKAAGATVEDAPCLLARGVNAYNAGLPNTPSLLIVPQFYKAGNLYQDVPPFVAEDSTMRFTVTRATTATRVNSSGNIESVASGVPRIDWLGQSCPALLVEASGQNLVLQSENFTTTWAATNISVSANSTGTLDPYGTNVADLLTATASGSARVIQAFSFVSGTTYTYSCFAKAGTGFFGMTMENGGVASGTAVIWNLTTGAFVVSGTAGSNYTLQAHNIESYGNGWYRCSMRVLVGASVAGNIRVNTSNGTMSTAIIQSDSGNTAYVFGAQLETGAIPTSYIPTTTGTGSRAADVISASGALVSGLIGQTEGTMYCEFEATNNSSTRRIFTISDNTTSNRIMLIYNAGEYRAQINSTSVSLGNFTSGFHKIAFAYQQDGVSGNLFASIDGGAVVSGTSPTFPTGLSFTTIGKHESSLSTESFNDRIRADALYTTRLSNDQLAELTRL